MVLKGGWWRRIPRGSKGLKVKICREIHFKILWETCLIDLEIINFVIDYKWRPQIVCGLLKLFYWPLQHSSAMPDIKIIRRACKPWRRGKTGFEIFCLLKNMLPNHLITENCVEKLLEFLILLELLKIELLQFLHVKLSTPINFEAPPFSFCSEHRIHFKFVIKKR